jgi:hypothetical protein
MHHTQVIDWRVWKAAEVAEDEPPIVAGGSPFKRATLSMPLARLRTRR